METAEGTKATQLRSLADGARVVLPHFIVVADKCRIAYLITGASQLALTDTCGPVSCNDTWNDGSVSLATTDEYPYALISTWYLVKTNLNVHLGTRIAQSICAVGAASTLEVKQLY